MIYRLQMMIGGYGVETKLPNGRWVRSVPEPFEGGLFSRLHGAWSVITGRAYPFQWPEDGELEKALSETRRENELSRGSLNRG